MLQGLQLSQLWSCVLGSCPRKMLAMLSSGGAALLRGGALPAVELRHAQARMRLPVPADDEGRLVASVGAAFWGTKRGYVQSELRQRTSELDEMQAREDALIGLLDGYPG